MSAIPSGMTSHGRGLPPVYNDSAIETDVPGFGIELQHDGQRFKLNEPLSINATDFSQKPKLEAVPVKAADAVLTDTNFFCLRNLTGGLPMKTAHIYSPGYALLAGLLLTASTGAGGR